MTGKSVLTKRPLNARIFDHGHLMLLTAMVLFYCRNAFFLGHLLLPGGDSIKGFLGPVSYYRQSITAGHFPLWNTLSMCGHPFGLHLVTFANLFNVAALFFNEGTAYNIVTILSFLLNAYLVYFFLLLNRASSTAAFLGALVWSWTAGAEWIDSGFFFMPLCFLLASLFVERKTRARFAALTFSIAFYWLNSNPQFFIYGSAFLFLYMVSHEPVPACEIPKKLLILILPFVAALAMSSFSLIGLLDVTFHSNRSSWSLAQTLLPTHLLLTIFPKLFNCPLRPDLDFMLPRTLQEIFSFYPNPIAFLSPVYLGIFPIVAVLFYLLKPTIKKDNFLLFFLCSAAFVLIYMILNIALYPLIIRHIPILNGMTNVGRIFYVYQFAMIMIMARAIDILRPGAVARDGIKRIIIFFVALVFSMTALFFVLRLGLKTFRELITHKIISSLHGGGLSSLGGGLSEFKDSRAHDFFYFFNEMSSFSNPHFIFPVALLAILLSVLYFYCSGKTKLGYVKLFLFLFVLTDLGLMHGFKALSMTREAVYTGSDVAAFIRRDPGLYRVMSVEDPTRSFSRMFLVPEANMVHQLATPDGYEQLYLREYVKFYSLLTLRKGDLGYILHTKDDFEQSLADFINCKYIVTTLHNDKFEKRAGYHRVFENGEYKVFANTNVLPRAFLVYNYKILPGPNEVLGYVGQYPERLRTEVVLEGAGRPLLLPQTSGETERADIRLYEPNRLEIDAALPKEGYLVLSEVFYPGWKVLVNGKEAVLERANGAFRAVRLSGGAHIVQMSYEPKWVSVGMFFSVLGLFGFLFVLRKFERV